MTATAYAQVHHEGLVSTVTINRPERLNAISAPVLADLHSALVQAQCEPATHVIVLTGAGRAFCAGDDLKDFDNQAQTAASIEATCESIQQITRDLMHGPKLVVGAIHGYAVGGGFEWLLNCDLVVAADDLVCFFPEMALGHFVTGGVTYLLPQAVGYQRAMELMVLGERLSAHTLYTMGLVNRVVPADTVLATAHSLAHTLAQRSPFATTRLKKALASAETRTLDGALALEKHTAMECFGHPDTQARIHAFATSKL